MRKNLSSSQISGIFLFLIATICVAIFFPILSYAWLSVEDNSYYGTNPLFGSAPILDRLIASWKIAPESNYMPLTWNVTILLSELSGHSAKAFHLASILLHSTNICLAFILLRRWKLTPIVTSIIIVLFAFHPLRVESVAWASSLKGLLAALFGLLALLAQTHNKQHYRSPFTIFCFALCLLCKQTLFLLPLVFGLISLWEPKFRLSKITSIILALLAVLAAFTASQVNADNPMLLIHQFTDGKVSLLKGLTATGHYLQQQVWPHGLIPEYPVPRDGDALLIAIALIGLSPCLLWIRYLRQIFHKQKTDKPSLSLICYTSFLGLMLPVLGYITTPLEFTADRLTYLPSLFFWAALVLGFSKLSQSKTWKIISLSTCALLAIPYTVLTVHQVAVWESDSKLTSHILRHAPHHYIANLQVANERAVRGDFDTALKHAEILVTNVPQRYRYAGWQTITRIHISLSTAHIALEALDHEIQNDSPILSGLHLMRIEALRAEGKYPEAHEAARSALKANADPATVHYHQALTYLQSGDRRNARIEIQRALELNPYSPTMRDLQKQINAE